MRDDIRDGYLKVKNTKKKKEIGKIVYNKKKLSVLLVNQRLFVLDYVIWLIRNIV